MMSGSGRIIRNAEGLSIPVTEEVYREYRHLCRREYYQEEQKRKNGVISLDAMGYGAKCLSPQFLGSESEIEDGIVRACYGIYFVVSNKLIIIGIVKRIPFFQ